MIKYGKLTIIKEVDPFVLPCGQKNKAFLCKCDCGNEKVIRKSHLVRGRISSCGCNKHGLTKTKAYNMWRGIKNRCYGNKTIQPHIYKDKGITMFEEWKNSFKSFYEWAIKNGYSKELQIDRIDNSKGYYPNNCRFVSQIDNMNNRDCTLIVCYNGQKIPLSIILRNLNIHERYDAIIQRIHRGWDHQKAIDTPIRQGNYKRKTKRN